MAGCGASGPIKARVAESPRTFCNPVNVDYRFMKIDGGDGIREAADPVVVEFGGRYYLFASKSSGYWHTEDFVEWTHVLIDDTVLPIEDYAPGLFVYDGYLYYVGSTHGKGMLYRSSAPEKGVWEPVKEIWSYWDPAFLVEGDKPLPLLRLFARRPDIHAHARPAHARGEARRDGVLQQRQGTPRLGAYGRIQRARTPPLHRGRVDDGPRRALLPAVCRPGHRMEIVCRRRVCGDLARGPLHLYGEQPRILQADGFPRRRGPRMPLYGGRRQLLEGRHELHFGAPHVRAPRVVLPRGLR